MATFEIDDYSIQKQMYGKIDLPSEQQVAQMLTQVGAWFSTDMHCNYYMLMCKEISYFTVFHFNDMNYNAGISELLKTLKHRGRIIDIRYVHSQDAYECWVKNENDEVNMYFLFPYNWGVVEIGGN